MTEENFSHTAMERKRAERGLTQAALAKKAGLGERTVRDLENGKRKPRGTTVAWLAGALECSYDDLLDTHVSKPAATNGAPAELDLSARERLEEIARSVAVIGGVEAMQYYRAAQRRITASGRVGNPSTEADVRALLAIIRAVAPQLEAFTNELARRYGLFAEELDRTSSRPEIDAVVQNALVALNLSVNEIARSGAEFAAGLKARVSCLFDPLDGTANFRSGLALFCTAVAIFDGDTPIVAAIYDPTHHVVYSGFHSRSESTGSAWMWDISAGSRTPLIEMAREAEPHILASHLTSKPEAREEFWPVLQRIARQYSRICMLNSGQLALALVAAGRLLGFANSITSTWDTAAGDVLVRAMGGLVTDFEGNAIDYRSPSAKTSIVAAADPADHERLLELIAKP